MLNRRVALSTQFCLRSILLLVLATVLCQICAFAQVSPSNALSKEKILALRAAGVSDAVLIQQIQRNGIDFGMDPDTTLELKNRGLPNEVLQVLFQAGNKNLASPGPASQSDSMRKLYGDGKFGELADQLRSSLKTNPSDYRSRALLIMTLLKMKEKDAAKVEYQRLATHEQDPAAAPLVKQVKMLFDSLQKTEEAKVTLIAALKDYRVSDAADILDRLPASATQKEILKINLDVYQGKYDRARDRFSKIQFGSYSEKERSAKIRDNITESEVAYNKLKSRIDVYLYPPLAPVKCGFPLTSNFYSHDLTSQSVKEYVELVNNLTQLVPLGDEERNLSFHAQLLTGQYDQLERLGDQLLKAKGNIRVPFYASDRFFRLVIDSQRKHIYTEADLHPYEPKFSYGWWTELVPFDLAFDQVKNISQKAGHSASAVVIEKKSYALKFEPGGVAPNYALMNILYCTVGEKAELTVTRNLGQYILHVIGDNNGIKTELADPSKAKGPSSGWVAGLLMMGAMTSTDPSLRTATVEGLQADQAQQAATLQAQQTAWESFTTRDAFSFVEADAFTGLEELLGVLN